MLEHVALNQTRFHTPGIAPDARGVVLGKQGALLFPSLDKLVAFLGIFSDELSLDDLLPTLKIVEVRTPLKSRELLVLFHAASSYLVDRAARATRLLGGLVFTGSGKHYVKYRDEAAPLGYDVDQVAADGGDFILYSDTFTQACVRLRELPFAQIALRLSLRPRPGGSARAIAELDREVVWLTIRRGLARSVLTYLWRNRVRAEAALVDEEVAGTTFAADAGYLLARVSDLPPRMLDLFRRVPGIEVHRPVGDNVVVEVGWDHPIRLESCQSIFDKTRFHVFSGTRDRVDVMVGPPALVSGERFIATRFDLGRRAQEGPPLDDAPALDGPSPVAVARPTRPAQPIEVTLRLVAAGAQAVVVRRVTATLIGWERAAWLKKLVFAVPPTVLAGYRVAPIPEGLLVLGAQGVDSLPIGELLQEAAPSIFVPVGHEFLPRVSPAVLTEHVGGTAGRTIVFLRGAAKPLAVGDDAFEPLGRRVLGRLEVELRERSERLPAGRAPVEPLVENDAVGPLPLWGFRAGPPPDVE